MTLIIFILSLPFLMYSIPWSLALLASLCFKRKNLESSLVPICLYSSMHSINYNFLLIFPLNISQICPLLPTFTTVSLIAQQHEFNTTAEYILFFLLIFIGVWLLYNVVLASTAQQNESAVHIQISPPFGLPSHLAYHSALGRVPCAVQYVPISCLFYT